MSHVVGSDTAAPSARPPSIEVDRNGFQDDDESCSEARGLDIPYLAPSRSGKSKQLFFTHDCVPAATYCTDTLMPAEAATAVVSEAVPPASPPPKDSGIDGEVNNSILQDYMEELLVTDPEISATSGNSTLPICSYLLRNYFDIAKGQFRGRQQEVALSILQRKNTLAVCPTGWGKSLCYQFPMLVHRLLHEARYRQWVEGFTKGAPMIPCEEMSVAKHSSSTTSPPACVESKFCIVVSPLLSLMADQSDKIQSSRVLKSVILSSTTSAQREAELLKQLSSPVCAIDIVFVSPEKFVSNIQFRQVFRRQRHRIALICVDEVHCVSRWSYDFRPSFMYLNRVFEGVAEGQVSLSDDEGISTPPFLCLTATATRTVIEDLQRMFRISRSVICTNEFRQNLKLETVCVGSTDQYGSPSQRAIQDALRDAVVGLPKPMIVYVKSRSDADELCRFLVSKIGTRDTVTDDFSGVVPSVFTKHTPRNRVRDAVPEEGHTWQRMIIRCYHAGLSRHVRTSTQQDFLNDRIDVLVATVAFGMGIDKGNIRSVVHCGVPSSLEGYVQEIGRAGRDGCPSHCRLLYNPYEYYSLRCRLLTTLTSPQEMHSIVQRIVQSSVTQVGEKLMLVSVQRLAEELLVSEEMIETVLFLMVLVERQAFIGIEGVCPLGYRISGVQREAFSDGDDDTKRTLSIASRAPAHLASSRKRGRRTTDACGSGVSRVMAQMCTTDSVLELCRSRKVITNQIDAANALRLSLNDFQFYLDDLRQNRSVTLSRMFSAFLIKLGDSFSDLANPRGVELMAATLFDMHRQRLKTQVTALHTAFGVLASPTHARIHDAMKELPDEEAAAWVPPPRSLTRVEAVSIANDFVEKNSGRLHSTHEAARCLLGIMPQSLIKHGKYAGQLPLSVSWYVSSPHFGTLREFDVDWVLQVLAVHQLDGRKVGNDV